MKYFFKTKSRWIVQIQIIFISFLFFLACTHDVFAQSNNWSKNDENAIYLAFQKEASRYTTSEIIKREYANCGVQEMKRLIPLSSDWSKEKVLLASKKAAAKCYNLLELVQLTLNQEQLLKQEMLKSEYLKIIAPNKREFYVDCLFFKLRESYPDGWNDYYFKLSAKEIGENCAKELLNKMPSN